MSDVNGAIRAALNVITNRAPGISHHQFRHPDGPLPGGFSIEWWIVDTEPLIAVALTLAEEYPTLRDRYTIPQIRDQMITIVRRNLEHFDWEPFIRVSSHPRRTLLDLARDDGVESVITSLREWAGDDHRAIFLMPVQRLRPAKELISPRLLWLLADSKPERLNELLPIPWLPDALSIYPPWVTGPKSGQKPLTNDDSLLVVLSTGVQAGLAELRRAAGAVSIVIPDSLISVRSAPEWANVFELSHRGHQVLNAFGPVIPWMPNIKVLEVPMLEHLLRMLAERASVERERRFRIALQSLSAGLVQTGLSEFMSYFISLDALFLRPGGKWVRDTVRLAASRLEGADGEARIQSLLNIRNETLHGQCPSIEQSRWYLPFYRRFGTHPTEDLLDVVRQCLRREAPHA